MSWDIKNIFSLKITPLRPPCIVKSLRPAKVKIRDFRKAPETLYYFTAVPNGQLCTAVQSLQIQV